MQPVVRILVAVAPCPGREACRLYPVKKRVAPLLAQHLAEQRAEEAHIPPKVLDLAIVTIGWFFHFRHKPLHHLIVLANAE